MAELLSTADAGKLLSVGQRTLWRRAKWNVPIDWLQAADAAEFENGAVMFV